jgi:hypothetical protein
MIPFTRGLSLYATAVFVVLWVGLVAGVATGGGMLEDAWAWLTGLEGVVAVAAWVLLLPIGVGLWAWNEGGTAWVQGIVLVGLAGWTLLAVDSLRKAFRTRPGS